MARLPRYVIPGQPQHIIHRGNNQQVIFAAEADYQFFAMRWDGDAPLRKGWAGRGRRKNRLFRKICG
jgi:hypothetical protein